MVAVAVVAVAGAAVAAAVGAGAAGFGAAAAAGAAGFGVAAAFGKTCSIRKNMDVKALKVGGCQGLSKVRAFRWCGKRSAEAKAQSHQADDPMRGSKHIHDSAIHL